MTIHDREIEQVATHASAYGYRIWGFGEGPGLLGLLAASDLLKAPEYLAFVENLVQPWLSRPLTLEDHVASPEVLLALERRTGEREYRRKAEAWADLILNASRPYRDYPPVHRPDLEGWEGEIWVDCLHTDGPGLAALGHHREALALVEGVSGALQGPCGLFSHGFDVEKGKANLVHWGRGCGWALLGLVGTLSFVPDWRLAERLERLLLGLLRYEEAGRWRTIVDDLSAPYESSVSCLVAYGLFCALRDGFVDESYQSLADRALSASLDCTVDGTCLVSEATPVGTPETYKTRALGVFPWGQGPLLLALATVEGWRPY